MLTLRTPPALRRAACRVGVVRWCARFARFPPVWRAFVVRLVCCTSAPAFASCGAFFRALFHVNLYQPRRASCGGLVGRCLAPSQHRRGRVLGLSCPRLPRVFVSTYERRRAYQHTPTRGRCPPQQRGRRAGVRRTLSRYPCPVSVAGAGAGKVSGRACVLARRVRGVSPLFPAPVAILRPYGVGDVWRLTRCAYVPPLLYRRDVSTRAAGAPLRASVLTLSILFQITFGGWLAALVAVRGIAPRLSLNTAAALAGWCLLA